MPEKRVNAAMSSTESASRVIILKLKNCHLTYMLSTLGDCS